LTLDQFILDFGLASKSYTRFQTIMLTHWHTDIIHFSQQCDSMFWHALLLVIECFWSTVL